MVGDPAYSVPIQCSNIHGNGEGISGDAQLGRQGNIQKTCIDPQFDEYLERLGLVHRQQDGVERGVSKGRRTIIFKTQQSTHSNEGARSLEGTHSNKGARSLEVTGRHKVTGTITIQTALAVKSAYAFGWRQPSPAELNRLGNR